MSVSVVFQTETDMVKHFRVIRTYTAEMPCKQFIFFLGNLRSLNDINIYAQWANNGKDSAIYQVTTHLQNMYMCSNNLKEKKKLYVLIAMNVCLKS